MVWPLGVGLAQVSVWLRLRSGDAKLRCAGSARAFKTDSAWLLGGVVDRSSAVVVP